MDTQNIKTTLKTVAETTEGLVKAQTEGTFTKVKGVAVGFLKAHILDIVIGLGIAATAIHFMNT